MNTDESPSPRRRRPPAGKIRGPSKKVPQDGNRIYRRRILARLKQHELAAKAGISAAHMSHIERGTYGASPDVLHRLAEALECTVADLMPEVAA